ncbi:AAA family ATPase [Mesobacillus jeotgali]|uniref:Nuclease SbcCD subunit C n=1 Tax=Mesobacillus jeotgali TaxID=129985 RepID=A0ABY9VKK9_9BACI|nr:AAA family ATPase [Mesobacillus jeotgali]WNF23155.1 AAA family ATPase [Mesobacillus jeotgali]
MAYRIKKILIENFKSIDYKFIDFVNKDLIVFDGPNGFGKTTIFDAIELVVCGRVYRVNNTADGRMGYSDLLFSKDKSKDTVIKIEFDNGKQTFTVVKIFDASKKLNALDRKPDNWSLFDTYVVKSFEEPLSSQILQKTEDIFPSLEMDELTRYFSLFYYIQQEEKTFFLKKPGKERMNEISQLFDTKKEQAEKEKLEKFKGVLERERREIDGNKGTLPNKLNLLSTLTSGVTNIDKSKLVDVEYFQLIPELTNPKEWDKKVISTQQETRNLFLNELRELYDFRKNFDEFLKAQKNKALQAKADDKQLLRDTIILGNFMDVYNGLKEKKEKEEKLRKLKGILTKEKVPENLVTIPLEELKKLVDQKVDIKTIKDKIDLLIDYKKNAGELAEIVQEVNSTRNTLIQHFEKANKYNIVDESHCPLCGQEWNSHNNLLEQIQLKGKQFRRFYDSSIAKFEVELDSLYNEHLQPIFSWIEEYLSNDSHIVDDKFFKQLSSSYKRRNMVQSFLEWCKFNALEVLSYLNKEQQFFQDIEARVEELSMHLIGKKHAVKNGYTEFDEKTYKFESIYQDLFASSEGRVRRITLKQIHQKAQYVDFQYFHRSSEIIKKLEIEISQLQSRLKVVELGIEKSNDIIKIYEKRIGQHWKRIMRDIEIPFYIYSGKLLQDYQRGLGLFIEESEGDGVKSIKFVANSKSDHDAVNYLSSGQMSALVIAFTLALNKVYGNGSMDILLIDDPVQTMDEINMASFVELLRNDFKHKQIFLSTHEDDVSRFIRYKFKKYGLEVLKYNVKDRFYVNS